METLSIKEEYNKRKILLENNPSVIYVESVHGCPYTCAMCKGRKTKTKKISYEILNKLEPYYKDLEVMAIHGFGEPLLADLEYFVEQAEKNNFVLHMNSTGFYLTQKKINLLAKAPLSIRFSVNAGTGKTYKKIMGQDFDIVRRNVETLSEYSEKMQKNDDFWFTFIVMKENVDEMEEFVKLSSNIGIKNIRFMRLNPSIDIIKGIKFDDRDFHFKYFEQFNQSVVNKYNKNIAVVKKTAEKLDINIDFGTMDYMGKRTELTLDFINKITSKFAGNIFPIKPLKGSCLAPWFGQLNIDQEGNVNLCCGTKYHLGNLNQNDLSHLWNSEKMQNLRRKFKKGIIPKACGYCKGYGIDNYPKNAFLNLK